MERVRKLLQTIDGARTGTHKKVTIDFDNLAVQNSRSLSQTSSHIRVRAAH
jgi:hypothetical protein